MKTNLKHPTAMSTEEAKAKYADKTRDELYQELKLISPSIAKGRMRNRVEELQNLLVSIADGSISVLRADQNVDWPKIAEAELAVSKANEKPRPKKKPKAKPRKMASGVDPELQRGIEIIEAAADVIKKSGLPPEKIAALIAFDVEHDHAIILQVVNALLDMRGSLIRGTTKFRKLLEEIS